MGEAQAAFAKLSHKLAVGSVASRGKSSCIPLSATIATIRGALDHAMRYVLDYRVGRQSLDSAFTPIAAVLHAAKRRLGDGGFERVNRQIARFDSLGELIGVAGRVSKGIGGQAVGKRVGFFDRFIE
jgi:hypothetical protein